MRNKYPGTCYRCGKRVEAGEGHFERQRGEWLTQHADCAIAKRGDADGREQAVDAAKAKRFFSDLSGHDTEH